MESIGNPGLWVAFSAIVLVMLAIDLFVVGGGKQHRVSFREAASWSVVWVTVSFLFAAGLWWHLNGSAGREVANEKTLEYITGYLSEKSLAVDNVFVWLITHFHWILYIFGAFLLLTGVKMGWFANKKPDLANNPLLKWLRGHMKISDELHGEKFFVCRDGVA